MAQSESQRAEAYRARMRALGLRPVQIWVPDTTRPGFAAEVRRQVEVLQNQPEEREALEFIAAVQDTRDRE